MAAIEGSLAAGEGLLIPAAIVIVLGIGGLVLAEILRIPSIATLLVLGVLAGPHCLNFVNPAAFGDALPVIIKLGIAVVIFEGAMALSASRLKRDVRIIRHLVSIGLLITLVMAAAAFYVFIQRDVLLALVFGSLVTITGPTVVQPLLERISVSDRLGDILRAEAVFLEPIGVIAAVLIFEIVVTYSPSVSEALGLLVRAVLAGALTGIGAGWLLRAGLRRISQKENINNLAALGTLIGAFALAETISPDSGILAAATVGILISRSEFAGKMSLRQFKEQLTLLVIGVVFILIAANVDLPALVTVGWRAMAVVALLIIAIRPLAVFASTAKSDLRNNERWFLSSVAPRGIVTGSVSALFAQQLMHNGYAGAQEIVSVVFMLIATTVILMALMTGPLARAFGVYLHKDKAVVIVGAHAFSRAIARRMAAVGYQISFVDTNPENCAITCEEFPDTVLGSALDDQALTEANANGAGTLLAFTANNETNILISQFARREFHIPTCAVLLQMSTDRSVGKQIYESNIRAAFGSRINLANWLKMAEDDELTFLRTTVGKDISSLKPLAEITSDYALPVFHEASSSLRLIFFITKLQAGDTIHFIVRKDKTESLLKDLDQFCDTIQGAKV